MDGTNRGGFESAKKYEDKVKELMQSLSEVQFNDADTIKLAEKKVEDRIIDFEKSIDEESMSRIVATHQINMRLIAKLRELRYDFNQDKSLHNYENIRNNAAMYLNQSVSNNS